MNSHLEVTISARSYLNIVGKDSLQLIVVKPKLSPIAKPVAKRFAHKHNILYELMDGTQILISGPIHSVSITKLRVGFGFPLSICG